MPVPTAQLDLSTATTITVRPWPDDLIDTHIALKRAEVAAVERVPHPVEYQLYYSA